MSEAVETEPLAATEPEKVEAVPEAKTEPEYAVDVEKLRGELEFIKRLLQSSTTVEAFVTAARAAEKIAAKAANKPYVADVKQIGRSRGDHEQTLTVRGLSKDWTWMKVKELLTGLEIQAAHVDKAQGWDLAIVQVADEDAKDEAVRLLEGRKVEGQAVSVQLGAPTAEEMNRLRQAAQNGRCTKRAAEGHKGGGRGRGRRGRH